MKCFIQFIFVFYSFVLLAQKNYNLPPGFSTYKDYDGKSVKVAHDFDVDGISDIALLCNSEKHGPSMVVILSKKYSDQNTFYYFSWDAIATSMKVDSNNVLNISASFSNGRYETGIKLKYNRNIDNMRLIGLDASYLGDAYNMNEGGYDLSINLLTGEYEYNGNSKKKDFALITLSNINSYPLDIPTAIPSAFFDDK